MHGWVFEDIVEKQVQDEEQVEVEEKLEVEEGTHEEHGCVTGLWGLGIRSQREHGCVTTGGQQNDGSLYSNDGTFSVECAFECSRGSL